MVRRHMASADHRQEVRVSSACLSMYGERLALLVDASRICGAYEWALTSVR